VQDEVGVEWRRRSGDVPLVSGERNDAFVGERFPEGAPELPARAGYDDAALSSRCDRIGDCVLQRCATRGSFQAIACSSGLLGSYSCVT